ncbi:MAG: hypothetical protein QOG15_2239 [Solirubrobacteraceae bacterium]|nr:hypothetical protein [Solirubrobacteraceae bacterium]
MDVVVLLVILAVICAAAWFVSAPLRAPGGGEGAELSERVAELRAQRDAKYREIRDAELDMRTGKMSEDDYRALDRELRAEATAILRELDEAES